MSSAGQRALPNVRVVRATGTGAWNAVRPRRGRGGTLTSARRLRLLLMPPPLMPLPPPPPPPPPLILLLLLSNMSLLFRAFPAESGELQNTEGGASDPWEDRGCALRVRTGLRLLLMFNRLLQSS